MSASLRSADAPSGDRFDPIVARLHALHPKLIDLELGRVRALLDKIGNPERALPPVLHVAGTNGKGSTVAFARAIAEAAGRRVHAFTSPHLVSFNERIRLAGRLVDDATLADTLAEVEAANAGAAITVFETITAAALLLFSRVPADLCLIEVGLGGRFDATNVVARPAACAITSISMDHRDFLGHDEVTIAGEKAGILKQGVAAATGQQLGAVLQRLDAEAADTGARLLARDRDWTVTPTAGGLRFEDASGALDLPAPSLPGLHQLDNAGIAVAALRAGVLLPTSAFAGIARAEWPARLQRLSGRLRHLLPAGWELWLDGGHNAGAGEALADHLAGWADRPFHLVVGMKQGKDSASFLRPLTARATTMWAVAEPGQHLAASVEAIVAASDGQAQPGPTVRAALQRLAGPPSRVLICGSLYLAGLVLKEDAS